ncbi:MAG: hypothetical protein R6U58_09065 [Bacteroidales bacterium]
MLEILKENINGILGTIIFHLLIVVLIMAARLSSVSHPQEHSLLIEFDHDVSEEEFRAITESLQSGESYLRNEENEDPGRNIAVNVSEERPVPDQFREMSSQQLSELDQRVDEILNDASNGNIDVPDPPEIEFETPEEIFQDENNDNEPYTGPTTITYDLKGRNHVRIPVPVYKCPDGGIVEVSIAVNQEGRVISADIDAVPGNFNEICIFETAVRAAMDSRFSEEADAPPVQSGIITFYFQKQ